MRNILSYSAVPYTLVREDEEYSYIVPTPAHLLAAAAADFT